MVVFPTLSPHVHSLSPVDFLLQISLLSEVNSRQFDEFMFNNIILKINTLPFMTGIRHTDVND